MLVGLSLYSVLGERERGNEWMNRALLVDPDNNLMRYNFACALALNPEDKDKALDMLASVLAKIPETFLDFAKRDPDFDAIRDDPRFKSMVAQAEVRLAAEKED